MPNTLGDGERTPHQNAILRSEGESLLERSAFWHRSR
jgi:hypothetical protein